MGLPLDWVMARLSVSIADGPYSGGFLWFSLYLLDGAGLSGNNLLMLQLVGTMLATIGMPYAGGGD